MRSTDRKLSELTHWANVTRTGMAVRYSAYAPTIQDDIPLHWSCEVGEIKKEYYAGYGTSPDQAIEQCYGKWQDQQ